MKSFCFLRYVRLVQRQSLYVKRCGTDQRGYGKCLSTSSPAQCQSKENIETTDKSDCRFSSNTVHIPVLLSEVLDSLNPQNGQKILDMTFGGGGHTKAIFHRAPDCQVFGLDRDPIANRIAQDYALQNSRFTPLIGRFSQAHHLVSEHGIHENSLDGVLFDVGASSMQFDEALRGFSLSKDGPLDMRMDASRCPDTPTAADVINTLKEADLYKVFKLYGEEKRSRLISQAIVNSRHAFGPITRTQQLADIVASVYQFSYGKDKLRRSAHVATKVFQALRIFVNNEMNELNNGLEVAHHLLRPGGVCVVIAFHSLEDRIAKRHFHGIDMGLKANMTITDQHRNSLKMFKKDEITDMLKARWEPLSKKVIVPSQQEEEGNPRSRSAKLRAARKRES